MLTIRKALRARTSLRLEASAWARRPIRRQAFTQNTQLLLISRPPPRAELPYLYSGGRGRLLQGAQGFSQLSARHKLFTLHENKTWGDVAFTTFQAVLLTIFCWSWYFAFSYAQSHDEMERTHQTPPDWSQWSRVYLHTALAKEKGVLIGNDIPNWVGIGKQFQNVISRCEDKEIDGQDVKGRLGDNEDIYVEGVGKTGLDITGCSENWRRGYYHALMGAGRCAERYDTILEDSVTGQLIPLDFIASPENPNPRPLPAEIKAPMPRIENCSPGGPPPETFYLKVITTRGFSTGQRVRAALAYADWLRYKGLNEAAQNMHTWAIDIAVEGASETMSNVAKLIDHETGVISPGLKQATANIILASESIGSHFALTGNWAAALPALLSVLRAERALPLENPDPEPEDAPRPVQQREGFWMSLYKAAVPDYPPAPPTGDEPLYSSPDTICASATTMAHIGELLFASDLPSLSDDLSSPHSPSEPAASKSSSWWNPFSSSSSSTSARISPTKAQSAGLAWTRQAADLAEATLKALEPADLANYVSTRPSKGFFGIGARGDVARRDKQKRCAECLTLSMNNWSKMVERFEKAEAEALLQSMRAAKGIKEGDAGLGRTGKYVDGYTAREVEKLVGARERTAAKASAKAAANAAAGAKGEAMPKTAAGEVGTVAILEENPGTISKGERELQRVHGDIQREREAERQGAGFFWSESLQNTASNATTAAALDANGRSNGEWASEARMVRDRARAARLLLRETGLDRIEE